MLKGIFKKGLAVVVLVGMLFSHVNLSVYADEGQVQQVQEQNRQAFNEVLQRNGIDPEIYSDIDFCEITSSFELQMFPSFDEYLFEFERRLMAEGPILLDRIRFKGTGAKNVSDTKAIVESVQEQTVLKENVNRFIIKYKNTDSSDKVKNHFKYDIETAKKFDKDAFKMEKNSKKADDKQIKKENVEVIKFNKNITAEEVRQDIDDAGLYGEVEYIQPDYEIKLSSISDQWGLLNIDEGTNEVSIDVNITPAWELSEGNGVIVAVIDSGIDITHQGLANNIFINSGEIAGNGIDDDGNGLIDDVSGWDFLNDNNAVHNEINSDEEIHGTHIAGIIAAQKLGEGTVGVAPKAKILPIKAFENGTAYTSDIIESIQYAEGMGANVVNCSWGMSQNNQALKETMANSTMLFVCASGNSGTNNDNSPTYPASYNLPNVISVASINNDGTLSSFSNYGVNTVQVAAPGFNIKSTIPNNLYGYQSGTSMAAPFVSGQAALIYAKYNNFNSEQIKNQIIYSSDRLSTLDSKIMDGNKVNCYNSLAAEVSADNIRDIYQIETAQGAESNNDDILNTFSAGDIKQVEAGYGHTLLLTENGYVYSWGENFYGQLGDGTTNNRAIPVVISFQDLSVGEKITSIAAGGHHSIAITSNGKVYTWGNNNNGQLGDGTTADKHIPTLVIIQNEKIVAATAGCYHSIAMSNTGNLYAWGCNSYGQLGDGTTIDKYIPTYINIAGETIISVAAGYYHSMAVTGTGNLYTWGRNNNGQLGRGGTYSPIQVIIAGETIKSISAGDYHSMAITVSGKLYTWGYNYYGQLGDGTTSNKSTPTLVNIANETITLISAGSYHSMAVSDSGTLYTWGQNVYGQLGDGSSTNHNTPTLINVNSEEMESVTAGGYQSIAVSSSGVLYAWGKSGVNSQSLFPLPIDFQGLQSGESIVSVSAGDNHTLFLTNTSNVYACGGNASGQLGDGTTINSAVPVHIVFPNLLQNETILSVDAGSNFSIAVTSEGNLYTWGSNYIGQLGDGTRTNISIPKKLVIQGAMIESVAAGYDFCIAVSSAGALYTWGDNILGELGDGTTTDRYIPTLINIANETVKSVAAGMQHGMAVTDSGKLYTWGYNDDGELGDGTKLNRYTPTLINIANENIISAAAGCYHSMALSSTGNLYRWGGGQLVPNPVIIENETIVSIDAGWYHSIALSSTGKLYTWGRNNYGQLGDGTTVNKDVPTKIIIADTISDFSAGNSNSIILTSSGYLFTCGNNTNGQLGIGINQTFSPNKVKLPKNMSFNSTKGSLTSLALTVSNIAQPYRYIYYVKYDTNMYVVDDLCLSTGTKELTKGYISGTNILVFEYDAAAGLIALEIIDNTANYTGILDTISFKSISDGQGKISVIYYVQ